MRNRDRAGLTGFVLDVDFFRQATHVGSTHVGGDLSGDLGRTQRTVRRQSKEDRATRFQLFRVGFCRVFIDVFRDKAFYKAFRVRHDFQIAARDALDFQGSHSGDGLVLAFIKSRDDLSHDASAAFECVS